MKTLIRTAAIYGVFLLIFLQGTPAEAQQLEPRRWTHLPVGAQFLGAGYVRTEGDILFDPALQVEDATTEIDTIGISYIRTFSLGRRSARLGVNLPYFDAKWAGLLEGEQAVAERQGLGDPRLRLSVLLWGGPALRGKEFADYRASRSVTTTVGAGLSAILPMGNYDRTKLLNIGGNRLVIRPELGIVHVRNKWSFEATGSLSLFNDNEAFWPGGSTREQERLFLIQGHVVRTFRPGLWASVSGGYGFGGQSAVNGIEKEDTQDNFFWAVTLGFPLSKSQGIKVAYAAVRTENLVGSDTGSLAVAWSVMF